MNRFGVFLLLLPLLLLDSTTPVEAAWKTLNGKAPLVIANGGTSGLYPDQTAFAYQDAVNYSIDGSLVSCDVQLVKSNQGLTAGICRTGLDLSKSTTIQLVFPEKNSTYVVNGQNVSGWFTLDITAEELLNNVSARQGDLFRNAFFDSFSLAILSPEQLGPPYWVNSEHTSFFEEHGLNMTGYLSFLIQASSPNSFAPDYVSATEVTVLRKLQADAKASGTKLIFKFLDDKNAVEPTTKQTYGQLLGNLSNIASFASGILVPKSYIWELVLDAAKNPFLGQLNSLVDDAHKAKLEVYAYDFFNDEYPYAYNYSFDPIVEVMHFIEQYNFSVDGLFTDFPTTASEAIACYASSSLNATAPSKTVASKQTIITHNGNSGDYPGCSLPAYTSAIAMGVDYIDCPVQITKDGVLICRESPDLILSSNVGSVPSLFQNYLESYPELDDGAGVFTFDLTWSQINSDLKCNIYSPSFQAEIIRDQTNDGIYSIMTLAEFLSLAKNKSVGAFIDIQNAVYIRQKKNLAIVDGVVEVLKQAGYTPSDKVMLQSEDSSALARLRDLNVSYPLMYRIPFSTTAPVSITAEDFVDIKDYATAVSIPKRLMEPVDSGTGFLSGLSSAVQWAHAQNLTAYYWFLRNENTAIAFDYKGDPTMQMYSLIQNYKVDGFITDFPSTAISYLGNHCLANGTASSNVKFSIPIAEPGLLNNQITNGAPSPAGAPAPDLVVPEPPLTGATPVSPAPEPAPSAASRVSTCLFISAALSVLFHVLAVL